MTNIFEGRNRYEFIDAEGLITAVYADSYEEAYEKYKDYCGRQILSVINSSEYKCCNEQLNIDWA